MGRRKRRRWKMVNLPLFTCPLLSSFLTTWFHALKCSNSDGYCCYNSLTRLSCNSVKSSHLCKVLVLLEKTNTRMRPKFSPILDQYYYHVIKRTTPPAWRKNVAEKTFLFSSFASESIPLKVGHVKLQSCCQWKILSLS